MEEHRRSVRLAQLGKAFLINFNEVGGQMKAQTHADVTALQQDKNSFCQPSIVDVPEMSDLFTPGAPLQKFMDRWEQVFSKHDVAKAERCIAAPILQHMGRVQVEAKLLPLLPPQSKLVSKLPPACEDLSEQSSLLGFMADCVYFGIEPQMAGSIKYLKKGEVQAFCQLHHHSSSQQLATQSLS